MKINLKIATFGTIPYGAVFIAYASRLADMPHMYFKLRDKVKPCLSADGICYQSISLADGLLYGFRDDELVQWFPEAFIQM